MRGLLAALMVLLAALPASALEKRVRVAPGERLETLAERLYGDPKAAAVLRRHNGIQGSGVESGELSAPFSERRKIRSGDTWTGLARELWGDSRLAHDLALIVAGDRDARLVAGRTVPVPVLVQERLARGQTLAALSRRYYATSDRADLLVRVNGIEDPRRLGVGSRIRVPVVLEDAVQRAERARRETGARRAEVAKPASRVPAPRPDQARARASSPKPASATPPDVSAAPHRNGKGHFETPLRDAINTYLDGSYDEALSDLEELRPVVLAKGDRNEQSLLLRHLVFVYVAFDRPDRACETWGALRTVDPDVRLDADLVSPKIRQLVGRCGN